MDFFIRFNSMLTTHLRALSTGISKTKQDGGTSTFINEYFFYEIFRQEKGKLFVVKLRPSANSYYFVVF
jgi:hypothetical protein